MKHTLDINNWVRKDHFQFFKQFQEPYFGVTVKVDCSKAYDYCKENGASFFLFYLHVALSAANSIENFRYRINGDDVVIYDQIDASPTTARANGTFGFSYIKHHPEFEIFQKDGKQEIERVKNTNGLDPATSGENVIHFSALPWLDFTSFSHARSYSFPDSAPKISFGKVVEANGKKTMAVSIHVHHGLMDGLHVGQFVERFQELMNKE